MRGKSPSAGPSCPRGGDWWDRGIRRRFPRHCPWTEAGASSGAMPVGSRAKPGCAKVDRQDWNRTPYETVPRLVPAFARRKKLRAATDSLATRLHGFAALLLQRPHGGVMVAAGDEVGV